MPAACVSCSGAAVSDCGWGDRSAGVRGVVKAIADGLLMIAANASALAFFAAVAASSAAAIAAASRAAARCARAAKRPARRRSLSSCC